MTSNARERQYQAATRRDTARAVDEAMAKRHPRLRRALAKAPNQRRHVVRHALRFWIFIGHPEFRVPCA